jgi:group I intron endonuclease
MEDKIIGIYKIENIKNKKVYIGSSKDINKRIIQHKQLLEKGIHHSCKLQRSYNQTQDKSDFKYSVVEIVDNVEILKDREQYYIDLYDAYNAGYNCTAKVDNPKYAKKNLSKKAKKEQLTELYDEFNNIYDYFKANIVLGQTLLNRIKMQQYSCVTLRKILLLIKWFVDNYDLDKYFMKITYIDKTKPLLRIFDFESLNEEICYYEIKDNKVVKVLAD